MKKPIDKLEKKTDRNSNPEGQSYSSGRPFELEVARTQIRRIYKSLQIYIYIFLLHNDSLLFLHSPLYCNF